MGWPVGNPAGKRLFICYDACVVSLTGRCLQGRHLQGISPQLVQPRDRGPRRTLLMRLALEAVSWLVNEEKELY